VAVTEATEVVVLFLEDLQAVIIKASVRIVSLIVFVYIIIKI
jgi:hypothetical protein